MCVCRSVPVYFLWIRYLSWLNYGNEVLVLNQWRGIDHIDCDAVNGTSCFRSGNDVIKSLKMNEVSIYLCSF